jgi:DNA-binding beta-propeller fold protein YncE
MSLGKFRIYLQCLLALSAGILLTGERAAAKEKHLLYVAEPGIRNYLEYGGIGVIVYDIDNGYRFVKRIPTWEIPAGQKPENVKGVAGNAKTGKLYVSTINRIIAIDLLTEKKVWDKSYEGGCDRMALSPDGKIMYVPSFEGPFWNVLDALTGDIITKVEPKSVGAHNTIYAADGTRVYLAGLKAPVLSVVDPATHQVIKTVGPFGNVIRPFTVNGSNTLCYVNENALLGFEVGDIQTGRVLHRIEVEGYKPGPTKRHGCPSHGIALTPDEKELWLADGHNGYLHVFDATVMPPKQMTSIKTKEMPGWVSFSIDGKTAYSSTGEMIDTHTKKIVATLKDETGKPVESEKIVEIVFDNGKPVRAGSQFGVGAKK